MIVHGKHVVRVGGRLFADHSRRELTKTDRVAMYGRTPGNYSQMTIPHAKVRNSRIVKEYHSV
jgi:hypothetical protein